MKFSKLAILFVALGLVFPVEKGCGQAEVNDVNARNASTKYLPISAEKLSQCDWHTPSSYKSCVEDWQEYTGEQKYSMLKVLKIKYFTLFDTKFVAEFRFFKEKEYYQILIKPDEVDDINAKSSRDLFPKFFSAVKNDFGEPIQIVDLSYIENEEREGISILADWILGSTRIRLKGFAIKTQGAWILAGTFLTISERSVSADLRQPVYLKLEGQIRNVGPGDYSEKSISPPIFLILDLNRNQLLSRNHNLFCTLTEITEDYLKSKWEFDGYNHEFSIDRRLGTFLWKTRSQSELNAGLDISGTVDVLPEMPKPKF